MRGEADTHRGILDTRIAWLATIAVALLLSSLLLAVETAGAAPVHRAGASSALEGFEAGEELETEEEEEEGELEEVEACEIAAEAFTEGELGETELEEICEGEEGEGEREGTGSLPPAQCLLRTIRPRAVAYTARRRLRLTLRYTTYEPTGASIEYGFGALPHLGAARRHLGRSGVLHLDKRLSASQARRLRAARSFTVDVLIPGTPARCARYYRRQLPARGITKTQVRFAPRAR